MRKKGNRSILRRYLVSYTGIVMLVCFSLGLVLLLLSSNEMISAELDIYQNRLQIAANQLEEQFAAMGDVLLRLKTTAVYQPFYLFRNPVYDLELIENFSRLSAFSPLMEEYYLWYISTDNVYDSGTRYAFGVFAKYRMNHASEETLRALLRQERAMGFAELPGRPDSLIVTMPLHLGVKRNPEGECVMILAIPRAKLLSGIESMVDIPTQHLTISYDGQLILGEGAPPQGGQSLAAISQNGMIKLMIPHPNTEMFQRLVSFRNYFIVCVTSLTVLYLCVAAFAAYRSYMPIKQLHQKLHGLPGQAANEIQQIEHVLAQALELNAHSRKEIEEYVEQNSRQHEWLKQQFMMMLIAGQYTRELDRRIMALGIDLSHPLFAIAFIHIREGKGAAGLTTLIESFTDESVTLYAAELHQDAEYAALINFMGKETLADVLDMLFDGFEAKELRVTMHVSEPCDSLSQIAMAGINALRAQPLANAQRPEALPREVGIRRKTARIIAAIEIGSEKEAAEALEETLETIDRQCLSFLMRAYMYSELFRRVNAYAYQCGMPMNDGEDGDMLHSDLGLLKGEMKTRVVSLCRFLRADGGEPSNVSQREDIPAYIRKHALEYATSLSSVAEAFGISTRQVTRVVKAASGMAFKEYLIQLRMEHAKQLLRQEDIPILQAAERVGYPNISHFIRSFKEYTGVTPGEYKKAFH